jgi:hypothetical protein
LAIATIQEASERFVSTHRPIVGFISLTAWADDRSIPATVEKGVDHHDRPPKLLEGQKIL